MFQSINGKAMSPICVLISDQLLTFKIKGS